MAATTWLFFNDVGVSNDHFDGGSGSDTLVMDWHEATTGINYRGLGFSNSGEIGMAESYHRSGAIVGDVSPQYLYFKQVERFELTGGAGGDALRGGRLNDILIGNAGDDVLVGGGGVDILNGGDGFDRATVTLSGSGNNTIRLVDIQGGGSTTLSNGTQLISIEALNLVAGDGDDFLDVRGTVLNPPEDPYAQETSTYFEGLGGNDTLAVDLATSFGATFDGGAGDRDLLIMDWSASQRNIYREVDEPDTYRTFSHTVTTVTEGVPSTVHYYYTVTFNNVERFDLTGGTGNDVLDGGALDDVLKTIGGRDVLAAGAGNDLLVVDWSADRSRPVDLRSQRYRRRAPRGLAGGRLFGHLFRRRLALLQPRRFQPASNGSTSRAPTATTESAPATATTSYRAPVATITSIPARASTSSTAARATTAGRPTSRSRRRRRPSASISTRPACSSPIWVARRCAASTC